MRLIVAGSRDYEDYATVAATLLQMEWFITEIVSGGCRGVDQLAIRWAKENDYKCTIFIPNWTVYHKAAGPIRNKKMAQYGDGLIAFWDGVSRGTKNMIDCALEVGMFIKVIKI
jgi:hypothetical protein